MENYMVDSKLRFILYPLIGAIVILLILFLFLPCIVLYLFYQMGKVMVTGDNDLPVGWL